jgi:transposase InsO family protein
LVCNAAFGETALDDMAEPLADLILRVQQADGWVTSGAWKAQMEVGSDRARKCPWTVDDSGLLRRSGAVYIPKDPSLRAEILRIHHDDPLTGGHYGVNSTTRALRKKYFWDDASKDIAEYVKTCDTCQRNKFHRHKPYGSLQQLPVVTKPHQQLTLDFVTGLPPIKIGEEIVNCILVVVDRFTKIVDVHAVDWELTSERLAEVLEDRFLRDGPPQAIITDRDTKINSKFWLTICRRLGIRRNMSTAFHPQSDGQTERMNQELERYLRCYVSYHMDDWHLYLKFFAAAHNALENSTTGATPHELLDGTLPNWHIQEDAAFEGEAPTATERIELLNARREEALQRLQKMRESQKRYYDKKHTPRSFSIGEEVLLKRINIKTKRLKEKLDHRYLGPFKISEKRGSQAYQLALPERWPLHPVFHVSLLEPYHSRPGAVAPPPEMIDGDPQWNVEEVLDVRESKAIGKQYLIRWEGFPAQDSWEPAEFIEIDCPDIVEKFLVVSQAMKNAQKALTSRPSGTHTEKRKRLESPSGRESISPPLKKRRPGRPKKQLTESPSSNLVESSVSAQKRKPGRPRKHAQMPLPSVARGQKESFEPLTAEVRRSKRIRVRMPQIFRCGDTTSWG